MTNIKTLEKNYKVAVAELEEVMQGGYDDIICRQYYSMMTDAQTEYYRECERRACERGAPLRFVRSPAY